MRLIEFRKKNTIRRVSELMSGESVMMDDYTLPFGTNLIWTNFSTNIDNPNENMSFLITGKKPYVISTNTLTETMGGPRLLDNEFNKNLRDFRSNNRKFIIVDPEKDSLKIKAKTNLIYNFGLLESSYRYKADIRNTYYRWYNNLSTVIDTINNTPTIEDRVNLVRINLPLNIPDVKEFEKHVRHFTNETLKVFDTGEHLIILEIFKWLSSEFKEESLFNKIKIDKLDKTYLMFEFNNSILTVNMKLLYAGVSENKTDYDLITPFGSKVFRKIFLLGILRFMLRSIRPETVSKDLANKLSISGFNDSDLINVFKQGREANLVYDTDDEKEDVEIIEEFTDLYEPDSVIKFKETKDIVIKHNDLKSLLEEDKGTLEESNSIVETLKDADLITDKEFKNIKDILDRQAKIKNPYPDSKNKLSEMLVYDKDEFDLPIETLVIPDNNVVFDKTMNKSSLKPLEETYIKKTYKKDMLGVMYKIQSNGIMVDDHEIEVTDSTLGKYEEHTLKLKPIKGKQSTIKIKLPVIEEDGTYTVSGNRYSLRLQKGDRPIRKINFNRVGLTTYYGKLFIDKATRASKNAGIWYGKEITKLKDSEENNRISSIINGDEIEYDTKSPLKYSQIGRTIKSMVIDNIDFEFKYSKRNRLRDNVDKIDTKDYILVGTRGTDNVVMKKDGELLIGKDNKYKSLGDIDDFLGLNVTKRPIEHTEIRIFKKSIPVAIILSYFLGLDNLMKLLKTKYVLTDKPTREIPENSFRVKFEDKTLDIDMDNKLSTIILAGLLDINQLNKTKYNNMNNKDTFTSIFGILELPSLYSTEIRLLENMYVDPISKSVLKEIKEPQILSGLLIRASELLLDDNYKHPNNGEEVVYRGYERIPGLVYNNLVSSIREFENKNVFSKSNITMNPYEVWKQIGDDSTSVLVDDLNPMAMLKQKEDVTFLGAGGRSKETLTKSSRALHETEIGIMSEATKDSGDVGISAYMSGNPKIANTRGMVGNYNFKEDGWTSTLSTSGLLSPLGINDDVKRANFSSIMQSHIVPIVGSKAPKIRTGYESVLPFKVDEKFALMAMSDGRVLNKNKDSITVEYKNGDKKTTSLGVWTSKEESGLTYKHEKVSSLNKFDTFKAGDCIAYDRMFFVEDIFDSKKILYKSAMTVRTALIENKESWEDSSVLSKEVSKKLGSELYKVKSFVLNSTDRILDLKDVGEEVDPNTILFTVIDAEISEFTGKLSELSISTLQELKRDAPKAKIEGKIGKIVINYNVENEDELDKSIKELIKKYSKFSRKVSSEYSISGRPLMNNQIEIKFYIEFIDSVGVGDKTIFSNQLKTTEGEIMDYELTDENKKAVDAIFSSRSISARIVNSPMIIGFNNKLLEEIKVQAVDLYFGK